jgi:ABC-type transporter Mla subunit MlaD
MPHRGHRDCMRRLLVVVALLAPVGMATGCGTSGDQLSKDDYQQELDQAAADVRRSTEDLGRELTTAISGQGSYADAAKEIPALREQLDQTANELNSMSPPEDAAPAHDRLVDALHAYSDDLAGVQSALESGNSAEIVRQLRGAATLESVKALERAAEDLRELGYDVET